MTTSTKVVWATGVPSSTDLLAIQAQAATMANEGKTDNLTVEQSDTPIVGERTITRTWTTLADAEEWVAFILQYNPVSAEIVP